MEIAAFKVKISQVLGVVPKALAKGDIIGKKLVKNYKSPQCLIE
jgi:hypothetical protein